MIGFEQIYSSRIKYYRNQPKISVLFELDTVLTRRNKTGHYIFYLTILLNHKVLTEPLPLVFSHQD